MRSVFLAAVVVYMFTCSSVVKAELAFPDFQGNVAFSHHNFTDVKTPYDGVDVWFEGKLAYWIDEEKSFAPYVSIIPVYTTVDEFFWQRSIQAGLGLQIYPCKAVSGVPILRAIRFFGLAAYRDYWDAPAGTDLEETDLQLGLDYYFDNVFAADTPLVTTLVFMNAAFHNTAFSLDDYNALLWYGDLRLGHNIDIGKVIILPYVLGEGSCSPSYEERWWENFLRGGAGIRVYPVRNKRFHVYGEVLNTLSWIGDEAPSAVEDTDYRIGIGFTGESFLGN